MSVFLCPRNFFFISTRVTEYIDSKMVGGRPFRVSMSPLVMMIFKIAAKVLTSVPQLSLLASVDKKYRSY